MKNIIIIGAGIAGLTAGIYARESGFDVTIYESHNIPGGASTSWRRKGYFFEGGMHWLTGSSPGNVYHKLWREVGALEDNTPIYNRDPFFIFETGGERVCLYRDIERLREHLLNLSPEDTGEIKQLCKDISKFAKVGMPVTNLKGLKTKNKTPIPLSSYFTMLPALPRMKFYQELSSKEYAMRYKSRSLQEMFSNIVGEDNSATGMIFTLATLCSGDGGYPEGGSLAMAHRMAEKFKNLGGRIEYNMRVSQVIVENNIASGVILDDGEMTADAVIVTQDALTAIDSLFEKPINEPWAEKMRRETEPVLNTFLCLGVKANLSDIPENIAFHLTEPIWCGGEKICSIGINNYASFKGYAPEGCTAITAVIIGDSYDWWKKQKENGTYIQEKEKLANAFMNALADKFPQTKGKTEVWDVATPLTYERYLHSYKGSWMTAMGKGFRAMKSYPSKPEQIANLYFAGQRLMSPGGLPVALESGRKAVQYLCMDNNMVFQGNS